MQLVEAKLKRVFQEGQAARADGQTTRSLVATAAAAAPALAVSPPPPVLVDSRAEKAEEADANMEALLAAETR